ncbi:hypothetical protein, partial [Streptomyces sp. NPDC059949]|uniref:hypothetical protein n=1 Tax=Streptomyces sp. NPDC059949 TaxID=3347013 RepID=UPI00365E73C2
MASTIEGHFQADRQIVRKSIGSFNCRLTWRLDANKAARRGAHGRHGGLREKRFDYTVTGNTGKTG